MLGMGPVIYPERSPPAEITFPAKLTFSESETDSNVSNLELSDNESTAGETYPTPRPNSSGTRPL